MTEMSHDSAKDFTTADEMCSIVIKIEGHKLYLHREVLAAWSPVFKAMFIGSFKEKDQTEIELPGKKVEEFIQLLNCIYPPIKDIDELNVFHLLPLAEEYQICEVKKRCEEYLMTCDCSLELLVTAQTYGLNKVLEQCIGFARTKNFRDLQVDPFFHLIHSSNLIKILMLRIEDIESDAALRMRITNERELKVYGCFTDFSSGYGNFCNECKSRRINDSCLNCLRMFRDKVKAKSEEMKSIRNRQYDDSIAQLTKQQFDISDKDLKV